MNFLSRNFGRYLSLKIINISKKKQKQVMEQCLIFSGIIIFFLVPKRQYLYIAAK